MIRINLLPGHKKQSFSKASAGESRAAVILAAMACGWLIIGGLGYYALDNVEKETEVLRQEAQAHVKRTEEIRKLIDEAALLARQKKVEDVRSAIQSVQKQKRSPVNVMFELAKVLSTGKMPDINEEKQRRLENTDPQSRLNPSWDASSIWLSSVQVVKGNRLSLKGAARDPADLDEFLKRMRSSVRFNSVTHPRFNASNSHRAGRTNLRRYNFTFSAGIAFWD